MRSKFPSKVLAKALANRFAAEALAEYELTPADLADEPLTAEERVAVYAEIRAISERLQQEAERLYSLV
ncbi:hypothetical protein [Pseudomonas sp.]|uniref:hypothetical protein n=1 Tax=Pseudomonas sp. TaxID=306 RepID=UPI00272F0D06|nr:hypothetical protein [Pseudomonas sp.]MBX9762889.1 hypothetical protein [Pseudomonadaceae bacterium]MDP2444152.1 hypothetical protein [Pseudomonas sp.]MDZ4337108.1 hypothetical protein [Pseudomonas sp.]